MIKKELKTKFNMSYADLSAISKQKVDTMLRDVVEFEGFGISQSELSQFFNEVRALDKFRSDDDLRGCVTQAVNERNKQQDSVLHEIRILVSYLLRVYKQDNPIFTRMRILGLSQLSSSQLFRTGESLYNTLVDVLPIVEPYGVSQAMLDSFYTVLQDFSDKIAKVNNAINERNQFTHERKKIANTIYDKLIVYTRIGRTIWENSNEALYNDYIIGTGNYSAEPTNSNEMDDSGGIKEGNQING